MTTSQLANIFFCTISKTKDFYKCFPGKHFVRGLEKGFERKDIEKEEKYLLFLIYIFANILCPLFYAGIYFILRKSN